MELLLLEPSNGEKHRMDVSDNEERKNETRLVFPGDSGRNHFDMFAAYTVGADIRQIDCSVRTDHEHVRNRRSVYQDEN